MTTQSSYFGTPYVTKNDYLQAVENSFADNCELQDAVKSQRFVQSPNDYLYIVADPFNKSYNVAKVRTNTPEAEKYINEFKNAFLALSKGMSIFWLKLN